MLVTDEAAEVLVSHLDDRGGDESCFRVTVDDKGLGFAIDAQRKDDETVEHDERVILVMEPQIYQTVKNLLLDVQEQDSGEKSLIVLEKPQN